MRVILSLVLSLILALAAQAEAVARSEMAGARDQVICGAAGLERVTLDAAGHVVRGRPCTHCLAAGLAADLAAGPDLPAAPLAHRWAPRLTLAVRGPGCRSPAARARAPPFLAV